LSGKFINEIGMCGKIPSRGDFLAQGLSAGFIDSWNEWLQAVMAVSREQLGQDWLDIYLTSPIWHFALSAGVCGKESIVGSMMPSVDQVGRHFPFTLACAQSCNPVQARMQSQWTTEIQQQILLTLDDEFEFDSWLATLQQTDMPWPQSTAVNTNQMSAAQGRPAWKLQSNSELDAEMLLHHSYRQQFGRYCVWWTDGSEHVTPCTLISSGLPQVSQYAAMLDGNWDRWNWQAADINCSGAAKE